MTIQNHGGYAGNTDILLNVETVGNRPVEEVGDLYDVDFSEYGDMSANYLGAAVLECAGTELPPYFKFLLQLQKRYPVISRHTFGEIKGDEMIRQYQMLQYNHLMEKNFQRELFSVMQ